MVWNGLLNLLIKGTDSKVVSVCACVCVYVYAYVCVYVCTGMYLCVFVCLYLCMCVCLFVCHLVCVHVCMCLWLCIYVNLSIMCFFYYHSYQNSQLWVTHTQLEISFLLSMVRYHTTITWSKFNIKLYHMITRWWSGYW